MDEYNEDSFDAYGAFFEDSITTDDEASQGSADFSDPSGSLTYVAHYTSPVTTSPVKGFFEFESIHRASSKLNRHDARVRMLEIYGQDAVSWVVDSVKIKRKNDKICGDQLELDFREPKKPRKRRATKKYL